MVAIYEKHGALNLAFFSLGVEVPPVDSSNGLLRFELVAGVILTRLYVKLAALAQDSIIGNVEGGVQGLLGGRGINPSHWILKTRFCI